MCGDVGERMIEVNELQNTEPKSCAAICTSWGVY